MSGQHDDWVLAVVPAGSAHVQTVTANNGMRLSPNRMVGMRRSRHAARSAFCVVSVQLRATGPIVVLPGEGWILSALELLVSSKAAPRTRNVHPLRQTALSNQVSPAAWQTQVTLSMVQDICMEYMPNWIKSTSEFLDQQLIWQALAKRLPRLM